MPIRINDTMPVAEKLRKENIFIMQSAQAEHQDIRELKIAIINIMPDKESTELEFLRLLSNSPLQTKVTFIKLDSHKYKLVSKDYLQSYYKSFSQIKDDFFDGLIITGAPVENLEFEQVDYWQELTEIIDWAKTNVTSTMYVCWASQAGLYYHYGIPKYKFSKKLFGVYKHKIRNKSEELTRGFDDEFYAPHSRYTGIRNEEILKHKELEILASSPFAGAYLVVDKENRRVFVNGHPEYSAGRLRTEYFRDVKKGLDPDLPINYFPDDDVEKRPKARWRGHANLLFSNWLNYYVYQKTPFELYQNDDLYYI